MKKSQIFVLLGAIYVAPAFPNVWCNITIAALCTVIAFTSYSRGE